MQGLMVSFLGQSIVAKVLPNAPWKPVTEKLRMWLNTPQA